MVLQQEGHLACRSNLSSPEVIWRRLLTLLGADKLEKCHWNGCLCGLSCLRLTIIFECVCSQVIHCGKKWYQGLLNCMRLWGTLQIHVVTLWDSVYLTDWVVKVEFLFTIISHFISMKMLICHVSSVSQRHIVTDTRSDVYTLSKSSVFTTRCYAECAVAMLINPSVSSIEDCGHIVWVTSKIITHIVRLWSLLSTASTISVSSRPRGMSTNFRWNMSGGMKKVAVQLQGTKAYEISICAKMYGLDLEWPLSEIQVFLWRTLVKLL